MLGGGVGGQARRPARPVRSRTGWTSWSLRPPRIEVSTLGADAVLLGARVGLTAARDLVLDAPNRQNPPAEPVASLTGAQRK